MSSLKKKEGEIVIGGKKGDYIEGNKAFIFKGG